MLLSSVLLPAPLLFSLPHIASALPGSRYVDSLMHSTGRNDQAPLGLAGNFENHRSDIEVNNNGDQFDHSPPIVQFQLVHSFTPANSKYIQVLNGSYDAEPIRFNPSGNDYMRANFTLDTATGVVSHWLDGTEFQLMARTFAKTLIPPALAIYSVNTTNALPIPRFEPVPCTIDRWSRNLECVVEHRLATLDRLMTMDGAGDDAEQLLVLAEWNAELDGRFHQCTVKAVPPPKREPQAWGPPKELGRPPRRVITLDEWLDGESNV